MNRLKIGPKLLLTYFILILCIFFLTSLSFRFISAKYLIHETKHQLQKEAKVISDLLGNAVLSNEVVKEKLGNRKALVVSERLMSSKMIIWNSEQGIIYTDLKKVALIDVRLGLKGKYVSETIPIQTKNGKTKGYVTLVAKLEELQEIQKLMRRSQIISLVISSMIAVGLGLFFKREITRPVRMLMEHMKHFSLKGEHQEIQVNTKDEISDLAESFNKLSRKLKQYDADQKVFFQNASHELKTPLMAIQGNAEGILDGVVEGEDVEQSLQVIISESQRLKRIVEGITYLARLEAVADNFHFGPVLLEEIIEEAKQSVDSLAKQRGIVITVYSNGTERLMADKEKLIRAFINLLGNSIRYAKTAVTIHCDSGQNNLLIDIIDDGYGIPSGLEDKIFQRFYSGEEGGSGIGLAITKAIIEGHDGTITARNGERGGAVFTFSIPLNGVSE